MHRNVTAVPMSLHLITSVGNCLVLLFNDTNGLWLSFGSGCGCHNQNIAQDASHDVMVVKQ